MFLLLYITLLAVLGLQHFTSGSAGSATSLLAVLGLQHHTAGSATSHCWQ